MDNLTLFSPVKQSSFTNDMILPIALAVFIVVILIIIFSKPFKSLISKERKFILSQGRADQATVVSIDYAGEGGRVMINNQPWMKFELEIHNGANPYLVSTDAVLSYSQLNAIKEGKVVPVMIHPQDLMKVVIEWEKIETD